MFYYFTALLVHTFSHSIWCFIKMFKTILMTFKLTWQNRRWSWHVYVCCISLGSVKHPSKRLTILMTFCFKFIGVYVYQYYYFNIERSDRVIAKIKWCIFIHSVVFEYCADTGSINKTVFHSKAQPPAKRIDGHTICSSARSATLDTRQGLPLFVSHCTSCHSSG